MFFIGLFWVTHRPDGQFRGVVIDVGDGDQSRRCVRQAKVQVPFHVGGLYDDGVLRDFLWKRGRETGSIWSMLCISRTHEWIR